MIARKIIPLIVLSVLLASLAKEYCFHSRTFQGIQGVYSLFGLLLCDTIHRYIKKKGGSCCFVLGIGSASNGSSAKLSAIFLKMPKPNHIKVVRYLESILVVV